MSLVRAAIGGRRSAATHAGFRRERQVLTWPRSVGLGRMLGLVGLFAAGVEVLTWPFLDMPATASVHAILIAVTILGSVVLLMLPVRVLTLRTSHAAFAAAIGLQTATAAATGTITSPYLSGYVVLILAAGLFASWHTVLISVAVSIIGLLWLAVVDIDLSGSDAAMIATLGTVFTLVGSTTSLLAAHQRHRMRRVERRLHSSWREASRQRGDARTDSLTGLGNRRAFDGDLATALADRRASGLLLAMVDVDGLKTVNDTLGHPAGDRLLQAVATALRSHVRAEDRVYRLGGDEFAAIVTSRDPDAFEVRLGARIEVEVPGLGWQRASVGVGRRRPGDEPAGITSRADAALYEAKHSARSGTPPGIGTADEMVATAGGPT